ncbi:hypothetical protein VHEMI06873 [[Torrubiella] hemipterigena]|uniref:Terpene synthase n=1 Tax=[Torrubiella] hemipterigena TaxID=1531966 RepID=A0A0A1TK67_9HYPO|nr:hypothetical protein VHEMI06873 [[Torrubiella] hemipterigena]
MAPSATIPNTTSLETQMVKDVKIKSSAAFVTINATQAPPSKWTYKYHPLEAQITEDVDGYFLKHWKFGTEKDKKKFVAAGFPRVTCLYFPLAKDDRIKYASKLLTILFLIDEILEDMSFDEGSAYNERLMPLARGIGLPNRDDPAEWIMYDLWATMRAKDLELANGILEPTFEFMRAQTDKARLSIREMGEYLDYRERDVGKASILHGYPTFPEELAAVHRIEQNCAKHLSVLNDIMSWEKEYAAYLTGHPEGSAICSAVQVLANATSLPFGSCTRILWVMCREWEAEHNDLVAKVQAETPNGLSERLKLYIKGLEYQMSGNEHWSLATLRYNSPSNPVEM